MKNNITCNNHLVITIPIFYTSKKIQNWRCNLLVKKCTIELFLYVWSTQSECFQHVFGRTNEAKDTILEWSLIHAIKCEQDGHLGVSGMHRLYILNTYPYNYVSIYIECYGGTWAVICLMASFIFVQFMLRNKLREN